MKISLNILFTWLIFLLAFSISYAQNGRLILNNNSYVVVRNNAKVVIGNPATNAITTSGTGGNIVTESEFNQVVWNIGTSTGAYTVPFTNLVGLKIPFTLNITTAGTGAGRIWFSTYRGGTWDNNTYRPSDVTHMFDYATGSFNNSARVIDRFWILDPIGYTTKPAVGLSFTYSDAEWSPVGNTITEANLGAQRFNTGASLWGDYLPTGFANTIPNTVTGVTATPANYFRSWTLVDNFFPLPVELGFFKATCLLKEKEITWSTLSESNTDYFEIEKSFDGYTFSKLSSVPAAGFSNQTLFYKTLDFNSYTGTIYYRLKQYDRDGKFHLFSPIALGCGQNNFSVFSFVGDEFVTVYTNEELATINVELYDLTGKQIYQSNFTGRHLIPVSTFSYGIYIIVVKKGSEQIVTKINIY